MVSQIKSESQNGRRVKNLIGGELECLTFFLFKKRRPQYLSSQLANQGNLRAQHIRQFRRATFDHRIATSHMDSIWTPFGAEYNADRERNKIHLSDAFYLPALSYELLHCWMPTAGISSVTKVDLINLSWLHDTALCNPPESSDSEVLSFLSISTALQSIQKIFEIIKSRH